MKFSRTVNGLLLASILMFTSASCNKITTITIDEENDICVETKEEITTTSIENVVTPISSNTEETSVTLIQESLTPKTEYLTSEIEEDIIEDEIEQVETNSECEEKTSYYEWENKILAITTSSVNLRSEPSFESDIIGTLNNNTSLLISNTDINGFYPASVNNDIGYVCNQFVSLEYSCLVALNDTIYNVSNEQKSIKPGEYLTLYSDIYGNYIDSDMNIVSINEDDFVTRFEYLNMIKDTAKKELITEFETFYSLSDEYINKAYNINLCCGEVSTVIPSGEDFNWHKIVGNTNQAEGYKQANIYAGGKVIKGYGGGVCQVSSTIYNCALNLNLQIKERHPHGMPVYYVDYYNNKDASVDDIGGFNFIFTNNKNYDIYIEATTSTVPENDIDHQGKLTVKFFKLIY